jgi:hypothetical protein
MEGKLNRGILFKVAKLCGGINNWFAFLSTRSGNLSLFIIHIRSNEKGSMLCMKLCMNFKALNLISLSRGSILKCSKRGAV